MKDGRTPLLRRLRRRIRSLQQYLSGYHSTQPFVYVVTAGTLGIAMTLTTLYTSSYVVSIDGVDMAVVEHRDVVLHAVAQVEFQGQEILGEAYEVDNEIQYQYGLNLKSELTDSSEIEHYLYSQLDDLGTELERYAVTLGSVTLGIVEREEDLEQVFQQILAEYTTEDTISAKFVESITTEVVYRGEYIPLTELYEILTANTTGETTYAVAQGDTFNAIAYANDMSTVELKALNPDLDPDKLFIGDIVSVKETIPLLSVITVNEETYLEDIPCPVEEVKDNSLYIGTTKVTQQGVVGEAEIQANITYLNGREVEKEVFHSEVVREPTTTIKAVGTLERPVSASYGSYIWPTSGRISSYFGGRTVNGVYGYHSGLDIAANYGTAVVAADGGTVTFSGWRSSYGNLVIITHDNGQQTYYAHNSSLLVSSGQKVYRGQTIARVGSTGNSTGNHLHFEVRIGGKAVNPLSYLP